MSNDDWNIAASVLVLGYIAYAIWGARMFWKMGGVISVSIRRTFLLIRALAVIPAIILTIAVILPLALLSISSTVNNVLIVTGITAIGLAAGWCVLKLLIWLLVRSNRHYAHHVGGEMK